MQHMGSSCIIKFSLRTGTLWMCGGSGLADSAVPMQGLVPCEILVPDQGMILSLLPAGEFLTTGPPYGEVPLDFDDCLNGS